MRRISRFQRREYVNYSQINAPENEQLLNIRLIEGRSNVHSEQGTANRCIFFENFMLELLFTFDFNLQQQEEDLRPDLSLILRW